LWVRLEDKQKHQFGLDLSDSFFSNLIFKHSFFYFFHFFFEQTDIEIHHLNVGLLDEFLICWVKVDCRILVNCNLEEIRKFEVMHSVQIGTFGNEFGENLASKVATVKQVITKGQEQQIVAIKVPKC
jgi:hypothetical protein